MPASRPAGRPAQTDGDFGDLAVINFRNIIGVNQVPGFNILYIPVPQVGHLPFIAGLPFFMVTFLASEISFFSLHFTQYPVKTLTSPQMSPPQILADEFSHTSIASCIFLTYRAVTYFIICTLCYFIRSASSLSRNFRSSFLKIPMFSTGFPDENPKTNSILL